MKKLQAIRERLGKSRAEVALKAGLSEQTLYLHESGRGKGANVTTQRAIAKALRCKVEAIFFKGEVR